MAIQKCNTCAGKKEEGRTIAEKFQDAKYGKDMRVVNKCGGAASTKTRCTCCGQASG